MNIAQNINNNENSQIKDNNQNNEGNKSPYINNISPFNNKDIMKKNENNNSGKLMKMFANINNINNNNENLNNSNIVNIDNERKLLYSGNDNNNATAKNINENFKNENSNLKTINEVNRDSKIKYNNSDNSQLNKEIKIIKQSPFAHLVDKNYLDSIKTFKVKSKEELKSLLNNTSYFKYVMYNIFHVNNKQNEFISHMLIIIKEKIDFFKNIKIMSED